MNKHTGDAHTPDYMIYEEAIPRGLNEPVLENMITLECVHEGCLFILRDNEIVEYIRELEKREIPEGWICHP